ncbi:MAG: ABC transporter substrate-binding protein [Desulfovibrio sp.]|nr:ABC transporter substrate-binding protein [Desulfovibrio sp.]
MLKFLAKPLAAALLFLLSSMSASAADLPVIRLGTTFILNNTSILVAMKKGDTYVQDGYSLHEIIYKEKYELRKDGKGIAVLDFVYGKGGADVAMAMSQNNADMGVFSLCAALSAQDKGVKIKIVSPFILAVGALTVHKDIPAKNLDEFVDYIRKSGKPVKIGYHSPDSAPILITRSSMASLGLSSTDDPYDTKANILYVNLKGLGNVQASLASHQVDAFSAPVPHPQLAVQNGYGRILRELRELPPDGKWAQFPCCTVSATETFLGAHPELVQHVVNFLAASGKWCTANPDEASTVAGSMLGLDAKNCRKAMPVYISQMTESWLKGVEASMKVLDETGYIKNKLKGKTFSDVKDSLIDFRFCMK